MTLLDGNVITGSTVADHVNKCFAAPMPKYGTEQSVYYMHEDEIKRGSITSCIIVQHASDDLADLQLVSKTMALFTNKDRKQADTSGIYYVTTDGIFFEDQIFTSKEHLRNSL